MGGLNKEVVQARTESKLDRFRYKRDNKLSSPAVHHAPEPMSIKILDIVVFLVYVACWTSVFACLLVLGLLMFVLCLNE